MLAQLGKRRIGYQMTTSTEHSRRSCSTFSPPPPPPAAMEEDDHISRLPDVVLGEIVSLLGTKEGGRTQSIATRWRHAWSSAPLNIDLHDRSPIERRIPLARISGILSSHRGPGRRFCIPEHYFENDDHPAATLDAWLRSPALDGLEELDFHYGSTWSRRRRQSACRVLVIRHDDVGGSPPAPPLPESACRFSSTLRVASFGGCTFPDVNNLHLPLLKQLSLKVVEISETALYALLAGCPVLQSLMLTQSIGCSRIRIVSPTLRSIGVEASHGDIMLDQLTIEDAPFLERLLLLHHGFRQEMVISVISAPKLKILGQLPIVNPILKFGTTIFKGSCVINPTMVLPSVKVLALTHFTLCLDDVIAFMNCFPCLENLYIKMSTIYVPLKREGVTNEWRHKYQSLIGTLDIRLKKIMLSTYLGNQAHVNFAEFFVLNARVLESMVLEVDVSNHHNKGWIEEQQTLLHIEDRASRAARFDFVCHYHLPGSRDQYWYEQTHDLSTADPFVGFDFWAHG